MFKSHVIYPLAILLGGIGTTAATVYYTSHTTDANDNMATAKVCNVEKRKPEAATPIKYYMALFVCEDNSKELTKSHSFGTFIETCGHEIRQEVTIGYQGDKKKNKGVNCGIHDELTKATQSNLIIMEYGPYEIQPQLFEMAQKQKENLDKGTVTYKTKSKRLLRINRPNIGDVYALADIDGQPHSVKVTDSKEEAMQQVFNHLAKWIINPNIKHNWVNKKLEIDKYSLIPQKN